MARVTGEPRWLWALGFGLWALGRHRVTIGALGALLGVTSSSSDLSELSTAVVSNIPLIWRLRLALHGVRLSRFAHRDLTTVRGERHVAYRVTMVDGDLAGAETAPLEARVNIRAASFVLRQFGIRSADLRADADGALLAIAAGAKHFDAPAGFRHQASGVRPV